MSTETFKKNFYYNKPTGKYSTGKCHVHCIFLIWTSLSKFLIHFSERDFNIYRISIKIKRSIYTVILNDIFFANN